MSEEDERWLPPSPQPQPTQPAPAADENLPGARSAPEIPGSNWGTPAQPAVEGPAGGGNGPEPGSGKSVASLVLGILGLPFLCPLLVPSILALVFGYMARGEYDRWGGHSSNRGMAKAGIILGWIGVAFGILIVVGLILVAIFADFDDRDGDDLPDFLDDHPDDPDRSMIGPVLTAIGRTAFALIS